MSEWITGQNHHFEFADKVAQRRNDAAKEYGRQPHNNAPTEPQMALRLSVLGARCELMGKLFLNPISWNAYARHLDNLPDLDDWIDVKGRFSSRDDLIIQRKARSDWAYLMISA